MAKRLEKPVHYEVFDRIKQHSSDDEWRQIFENAAHGKFIDGYSYSNGKFIFKSNGRRNHISICGDPQKTAQECEKFMRRRKFRTKIDLEKSVKKMEKRNKRGWSAIRNAYLQTQYLYNYIDTLTEEYRLIPEQVAKLSQVVFLNHLNDNIGVKNVEFENGEIVNIKGLTMTDGYFSFRI